MSSWTTMSSWKNLPVEILDKIFSKLPSKDMEQCSITCHSWKSTAQRVLFKHLTVRNDQQLHDLAITMSYNSSELLPANFVRVLHCQCLSESVDLKLVDQLFPFIEEIHIANKHFDNFRQLMLEGAFPSLKEIPYRRWDKDQLELVLERKENIRKLVVNTLYFEILEKLHLFPQLHLLKLSVSTVDTTMCLESLLMKAPPQLRSIQLSFTNVAKLGWSTAPKCDIKPLLNIEDLEIYSDEILLEEESYFYLMEKFPNLKVLELDCASDGIFRKSNYIVPSLACLYQFLVYLFNIETRSTASAIITDQHTPELVARFFDYVLNQRSKHYYISIQTHLKILFYVIEEGEVNQSPDRIAHISVSNTFEGNTKICEVKSECKMFRNGKSLPYNDLFQKLGNVSTECLTVGDEEADNWEFKAPLTLDMVFDHFNNLKTLRICNHSLTTSSTEKIVDSLENLEFLQCGLKEEEVFSQISTRLPNLKKMDFAHCSFTDGVILQDKERIFSFKMPSTSLNDLKFLVTFENYEYVPEDEAIFIRLKTANSKPRYCKLYYKEESTHYVVPEDGHADYVECLDDKDCIIYDIYCKAVKILVVGTDFNGKAILEEKSN